ncbi:glutamate-rich protein 3 isoform X2 [Tiliqua scincoides]|uniref:glutamate-rich protein 3 isoform X2 n=1 Tax=Tiliqua scincoides TaxID=71010 RepID=UPI003463017B
MNHPHPGSLATYNSLTDKHLAAYFSNIRIRHHLQRSGLISRSGRIISEKEYRLNAMRKDHQKYIRECLAQAIFHKVLDMEHRHQVEIKRKLENSARKERVQRIKVEQSRRSAEDPLLFLSPHPPTAPRNHFGRHRLGDRGQPGHSATLPRPSTAPGNIQHPVRLQPIYNNATTESTPKATSSSRSKFSAFEKEHHFASGERGVFRHMYSMDFSTTISPYRLPIINNYVIPVPPPPPKNDKNTNMKFGTSRGRRFRPTTAPNGLDQLLVKDTGKFYKPQIHSNAYVSMIYLGKSVHLSHDLFDYRDEIKIYQQHCGGENVCVYKGKLLEGETFQFISRRHHGFPFSLTFYLNGIQVDRLSSCCEYKHRKGTRLGGKHGHFGFVNVERSSPCYRCIIAMGLDKQPSPPKRKVTDENEEKKEDSRKDNMNHKLSETSSGVGIGEENKDSSSQSSSTAGEGKEFEEMEVEATKDEMKSDEYGDERERNQTGASDNAYDEDFEADEEKSDEKVNEEGQVDDQMNGMSKSPSDDVKDNLDHEKESENSSQKALQASDSERDESDGYSESDSEEDKQDRKRVPSLSPSSTLYSSDNDSEGNAQKQDDEKDNTDVNSDYENEVTETQREEGQETDVEEEEEVSEADDTEAKNVPGHKKRTETTLHGMTTVSEKLKLVGSVDTREVRNDETLEAEAKSKESSEDEREGDCKSVKEKIAEAFENDPLLSSEPEPSDSSTEDEEEDVTATQDKHEVPDGISLADEDLMKHKSHKVVEQEEQERQMVGKDRALEKVEVVDEEGSKEAALEEEFPAKNVVTIVAEQKVKKDLVIELEAATEEELDLEMDNFEKEKLSDSEEEMKGEDEVKELGGTASTDEISQGDDILYGSKLQREQVENPNFTEEPLFIEKISEGKEDAVEAAEIVGTRELVENEIVVEEAHEVIEVVNVIVEADAALGTTFVQRDSVEETLTTVEEESERSQSPKGREHEAEAVEKVNVMENETTEEGEPKEEEKYFNTDLKNTSGMEVDPIVFRSKEEAEIISIDEKANASEELIDGGNSFKGELPSGVEKIVQKVPLMCEEKLEQTFPEAGETKNIDTEEDSEQEKVDSWVEEPSLDWETEGSISALEEENKKDHQGEKVMIEEAESSYKLITGGEATIKATVKTRERAQEEDRLVQAVEEDFGGAEEMTTAEETVPERKVVIEKQALSAEEAIKTVPEAIALVAEETARRAEAERKVEAETEKSKVGKREVDADKAERVMTVKGEVEAEETEKEVTVKGEVDDETTERVVVVKGEVEAEEAEREVTVKGEVEAEEAEREVAVKGEVEAEEAEREVAVKGEVEAEETEREVMVKGEVEAEEAEREVAVKGEVEAEEAEREVAVKGEVDAEEAVGKVTVKGEVEAEETEREVMVKGEVDGEETERVVVVKAEVEAEEAERLVTVKGEVEAEETEREVAVKGEVEAEEAVGNVTVKGEVDVQEAEGEVAVKGEVEVEDSGTEVDVVSVDIEPEGEIISEVTIMGRENVVNNLGVKVAEAEQISESSAQEVALEGEGLTQEKSMMNEPTIQDKVEKPSEDTAVGKTSIDLQMKKEEVTAEKEKKKETGTEEQMIEGVVPLQVVEEALLIGIQQLITDVTQLSVAVEDKEEDRDVESVAEEKSSHENPVREAFLADEVPKESKTAQDEEADQRGAEQGKEIHVEEKDGRGNLKTEAGDYPVENLLGTEAIPLSAQQSGREQQQEISAPLLSLEPAGMPELKDEH